MTNKVHIVLDLVYGDEGNPGIRLFKSEDDAIAEERRLLDADPKDGTYLVIRETAEIE